MSNYSKVYGGYGGVTKQNFYVPPGTPGFEPQSARIPFTVDDKENLEEVAANIGFYAENAPNIMIRTSVSVGSQETFTISTSANPEDTIVYTADTNGINLNVVEAGYF